MIKRVNYYIVESNFIDSLAFCLLREAKEFIMKYYPLEEARIIGKSSDKRIINYTYYKPTTGFSITSNLSK